MQLSEQRDDRPLFTLDTEKRQYANEIVTSKIFDSDNIHSRGVMSQFSSQE